MPLSLSEALLALLIVGWVCVIFKQVLPARTTRRQRSPPQRPEVSTPPATTPAQVFQNFWEKLSTSPAPGTPSLPKAADLLIVDDSAVARSKLRRLFTQHGYTVNCVNDGLEALQRLRAGHYDLMITDLEMPNLDGIALVRECQLSPATAGMPIIAVSGHQGLRAQFNECQHVGGIHRKPWSDDILLSHVAMLIESSRGRATHHAQHRHSATHPKTRAQHPRRATTA